MNSIIFRVRDKANVIVILSLDWIRASGGSQKWKQYSEYYGLLLPLTGAIHSVLHLLKLKPGLSHEWLICFSLLLFEFREYNCKAQKHTYRWGFLHNCIGCLYDFKTYTQTHLRAMLIFQRWRWMKEKVSVVRPPTESLWLIWPRRGMSTLHIEQCRSVHFGLWRCSSILCPLYILFSQNHFATQIIQISVSGSHLSHVTRAICIIMCILHVSGRED